MMLSVLTGLSDKITLMETIKPYSSICSALLAMVMEHDWVVGYSVYILAGLGLFDKRDMKKSTYQDIKGVPTLV